MTDNKTRTSEGKLCPNLHKSKLGAGIKDSSRTASQGEARELRELEEALKSVRAFMDLPNLRDEYCLNVRYGIINKALIQARQEATAKEYERCFKKRGALVEIAKTEERQSIKKNLIEIYEKSDMPEDWMNGFSSAINYMNLDLATEKEKKE